MVQNIFHLCAVNWGEISSEIWSYESYGDVNHISRLQKMRTMLIKGWDPFSSLFQGKKTLLILRKVMKMNFELGNNG